MPKIQFRKRRFQSKARALVEKCDAILTSLTVQGYRPTLRQLYYQLVKDNVIANNLKEYKNLVRVMTAAREHGLIDWNHLYDFTRQVSQYYTNESPEDAIIDASRTYNIDLWEGQPHYVEVWVEKDALKDVIAKPSKKWQTPYFSCRGYTSASAMYRAHLRLNEMANDFGRDPIIIHVGDHDPSGIQMTDDIQKRHHQLFGTDVKIDRIALNLDQIRERDLPPNPAKQSDSRYKSYCKQFGVDDSWELDALTPKELDDLISDRIEHYLDTGLFNARKELRKSQREQVAEFGKEYDFLTQVLEDREFLDNVLQNRDDVEDFMNSL